MQIGARLGGAVLLFAFGSAVLAANPPLPAGVKRAGTVEGITEYTLPNGLRILFAPDASKPTTTVNTTYLVGSRHENYGETGMAHLLEHLLFKGTPTHPLVWYLRWSADAMTHSFIARKDLDSEMTVVRNELELGENQPFRSLWQRTVA